MKFLCVGCKKEFESSDNRRKYCSKSCSTYFLNKSRVTSSETKNKISLSLKNFFSKNSRTKAEKEKNSLAVGKATRGKYNSNPKTILELSKRTVSKILKRLKVGCSRCGWNKSTCDLHHINGRKIPNCDSHENLTYLCPNCHRECHVGLIPKEQLINLKDYIGDSWKQFYYG